MTAIPASVRKPPELVVKYWCPHCGRSDALPILLAKRHYYQGETCPGKPVELHYRWDGRLA